MMLSAVKVVLFAVLYDMIDGSALAPEQGFIQHPFGNQNYYCVEIPGQDLYSGTWIERETDSYKFIENACNKNCFTRNDGTEFPPLLMECLSRFENIDGFKISNGRCQQDYECSNEYEVPPTQPPVPSFPDNRLTLAQKTSVLSQHNYYRSQIALGNVQNNYDYTYPKAAKMAPLQWDENLARVAQYWADTCSWNHNANRKIHYWSLIPCDFNAYDCRLQTVGENIFYGSTLNVGRGPSAWFAESKRDVIISATSDGTELITGVGVIGHFTEMIWETTTRVGCALGCINPLGEYSQIVCNYSPSGNVAINRVSKFPYTTASETGTECPENTLNQTTGLCGNQLPITGN